MSIRSAARAAYVGLAALDATLAGLGGRARSGRLVTKTALMPTLAVTAPRRPSLLSGLALSWVGDVALLGCVGDDGNGTMLLDSLRESGVDVSHVQVLQGVATGSAMIAVDDSGENCIIVSPGANGRLSAVDVEAADEFFDTAGDSSMLTLCLEVSIDAVKAAAREAHERGARVVLNLSPYAKVGADVLDLADLLVVNAHELADLTEQPDFEPLGDWTAVVEATRAALGETGPRTVVVTLGADGARTIDLDSGEVSDQIPSPKITPVDTTGAGDAFVGVLAAIGQRLVVIQLEAGRITG